MAFDTFSQTFYVVLTTSAPGETPKKTLFGVARQVELELEARFNAGRAAAHNQEFVWKTDPAIGKWEISIKWPTFQQYRWPDELTQVSKLQFTPVQVTKPEGAYLLYMRNLESETFKTLQMIGTVRDTTNAEGSTAFCADKPCGFLLNQTYANEVNNGRTAYLCPAAVIQLNINADGVNAYRTKGELGNPDNAATEGEPCTILKWLDEKYDLQQQSEATYSRTTFPADTSRELGFVGKNLVAGVSGYRAELPEDDVLIGSVRTVYTPKSATILFAEVEQERVDWSDKTKTYMGENAFDGIEQETADGGTLKPHRAATKFNFGVNTSGADTFVPRYLSEAHHMPLFLFHSGETSKAADYSLSVIFEDSLKTIGPRSYATSFGLGQFSYICMIDPGYSCDLCAQLGRPCAVYATAGETAEMVIYAINAFGAVQQRRDDNFTVSIVGDGFPANDQVNNPADMPPDGINLGPVWRRETNDEGQPIAGSFLAAGGQNDNVDPKQLEGPERWGFPNYHDVGSTYEKASGTPDWVGPGYQEECDADGICSMRGCGRYESGALAGLDKCVRFLKRPVVIAGGRYRVKFAIDHAGHYALETTFRGERQLDEDGQLDLGDSIKPIPLYPDITGVKLIVLPGRTSAGFTITSYNYTNPDSGRTVLAPLFADAQNDDKGHVGTVGINQRFVIQAHDRFGNKRTSGGDTIDMSMNGGKQKIKGSTRANALADDGSELPKYDPIANNAYAEVRPILRNITGPDDEPIIESTGEYEVRWLVTLQQRRNPFMETKVELVDLVRALLLPIYRGTFVTRIMQGPTSGANSFCMHEKQTVTGLAPVVAYPLLADENKIVAGFTEVREWQAFTLQTRDRFGNNQEGNPGSLNTVNVTIR